MKLELLKYLIVFFLYLFPKVVISEPTRTDFFNYIYSQASFLSQCVSYKIIYKTDVPNYNIKKSSILGFTPSDFWEAMQKGAKSEVYDLLQQKWVKISINKKWCDFVFEEQKKVKRTLSRY